MGHGIPCKRWGPTKVGALERFRGNPQEPSVGRPVGPHGIFMGRHSHRRIVV